jgi:hypothetical protein
MEFKIKRKQNRKRKRKTREKGKRAWAQSGCVGPLDLTSAGPNFGK